MNENLNSGPLDISAVRELKPMHDFGSLRVPNRPDVDIRIEVEQTSQVTTALFVDIANSTIRIQAFAAPRNQELWPEIRATLISSIETQGGKFQEQIGSFGTELLVEVPTLDENNRPVSRRHLRFLGFDGPRWFLRVEVSGAALTDPVASGYADELIRGLVVNRGDSAMPPRDLLPLLIPAGSAGAPRI
ncbi:MAG: hypothetical protein RLZ28_77 [Actinomycetota bacterium]|jgi:hypothetical protein